MGEAAEFIVDDSITIRMVQPHGLFTLADLELFCRKARRANAKSDQRITYKSGSYTELQVKIKREGEENGTA